VIWSSIKAKLYIGITLLVVALFGALKIQSARLEKSQQRSKVFKAQMKKATKVMKKDVEIEQKFNSRRAEAKDEIKKTGGASAFRNPGKLRD